MAARGGEATALAFAMLVIALLLVAVDARERASAAMDAAGANAAAIHEMRDDVEELQDATDGGVEDDAITDE